MKYLLLGAGLIVLTVCQTSSTNTADEDVFRFPPGDEVEMSDLTKLSGTEIQEQMVGQRIIGTTWTTQYFDDGAISEAANGGSWTNRGTWSIQGDQFCRQFDQLMRSDIYRHNEGEAYYFSDWENPGVLERWYMLPS